MKPMIPDEWIGERVIVTKPSGTFIIGKLINIWEADSIKPRNEAFLVEDMTGEVFLIASEETEVELYSEENIDKLDVTKSNFWQVLNK